MATINIADGYSRSSMNIHIRNEVNRLKKLRLDRLAAECARVDDSTGSCGPTSSDTESESD